MGVLLRDNRDRRWKSYHANIYSKTYMGGYTLVGLGLFFEMGILPVLSLKIAFIFISVLLIKKPKSKNYSMETCFA